MIKKIGLGVILSLVILGIVFLHGDNHTRSNIVLLENQKKDIDSELAIKTVNNVKNFEGIYWLNEEKILGIKDQVVESDEEKIKNIPIITVYNTKNKKFEDLVSGKEGELMGIKYVSKDEKNIIYNVLIDGNLSENRYDIYSLNRDTLITKKIAGKVTATSKIINDNMFIAIGVKIYKFDLKNDNLEEILLSKDLVEKLSDFESFTFQNYLDKYYKYEKLNEETLKILENNYNMDKKYNGIIRIGRLGNKLYLQSKNGSDFVYDIIEKSYKKAEKIDHEKFFAYQYQGVNNLFFMYPTNNLKRECLDDGNEELWKIGNSGKKIKLIAKGNFITDHIQASPDHTKIAYYLTNLSAKTQESSAYIYDLKKDKQIKIFPKIQGMPIWNKSSKQFFMSQKKINEDGISEYFTSIVNLND